MALFGKKKLSLEEILDGISNLSDEDKGKVMEMLNGETAEPTEPTEETSEVENIEETPSENKQENEPAEEVSEFGEMASDNVGEAEEGIEPTESTGPMVEEPTNEPVSEEPTTEPTEVVEQSPEVKEQEQEQDDAQTARLQALEEQVASLTEKLEQALSMLDNKDFGLNPSVPEGGGQDHSRMSAVMRGYAGENSNKYY